MYRVVTTPREGVNLMSDEALSKNDLQWMTEKIPEQLKKSGREGFLLWFSMILLHDMSRREGYELHDTSYFRDFECVGEGASNLKVFKMALIHWLLTNNQSCFLSDISTETKSFAEEATLDSDKSLFESIKDNNFVGPCLRTSDLLLPIRRLMEQIQGFAKSEEGECFEVYCGVLMIAQAALGSDLSINKDDFSLPGLKKLFDDHDLSFPCFGATVSSPEDSAAAAPAPAADPAANFGPC